MLILDLSYKVPLEQADAQMAPHMAWVKEGYDKGWFLGSGRKTPRTGGVIFARGDRAEIEAFCASDPFVAHGIADYAIIDVTVTTTAPGFDALKDG
ncbi:YciI family protein [Rhizobium sp. TRM95796]|uniref:YciI family protein n=1 Tax=Rhizobium sp. TRM95796 TaxID=2979862 RepID=UPI0021E8A8F5|nr:YciI family protein [Rhizobium sp. TRM95796]MCV3765829.1 YciI family protein [Rhizobium sp. TRM95796]